MTIQYVAQMVGVKVVPKVLLKYFFEHDEKFHEKVMEGMKGNITREEIFQYLNLPEGTTSERMDEVHDALFGDFQNLTLKTLGDLTIDRMTHDTSDDEEFVVGVVLSKVYMRGYVPEGISKEALEYGEKPFGESLLNMSRAYMRVEEMVKSHRETLFSNGYSGIKVYTLTGDCRCCS